MISSSPVPNVSVSREVVGVMAPMRGDRFPADVTARWSVNFWVDDTDAIADRTVQLGGKAVVPPYDAPGFRKGPSSPIPKAPRSR